MTTPTQRGAAPTASANAQFKRGWGTRMVWATGISVVVHSSAFALLPSLRFGEPALEAEGSLGGAGGGLILMAPFAEQGDARGSLAVPATPLGDPDGTASVPGEVTVGLEGPVVTDDEPGSLWSTVGDRLRRGRNVVPALAVPTTLEPGPATRGSGRPEPMLLEEDEELPDIRSDVITVELADLPASDSLSLDRLTGLRPDLAVMTASAWVLIRNQEAVEAYLRRTYYEGRLDPAIRGSVGITLWIDPEGSVEWAEVSQSSGRIDLDEVALALFSEVADFRAARERGQSVSRSVTFSLNFPW